MNDEVRAAVNARLAQKGMTRADLARAISKTPQTLTRALNGTEGGGTVPPLWAAILEALDLELTAHPYGSGRKFESLFSRDEIEAIEHMLARHHTLIKDFPEIVIGFFYRTLENLPRKSTTKKETSQFVCRLILGRLMQDIRGMTVCAGLAYSTSVAAIAASIFELAFELIFLSRNEERAKEWIIHQDITKSSSKMGERIENYVENMGIHGKDKNDLIQKYFEPYRIISMAKHGNPRLQRNLNLKHDISNNVSVIATGPDPTDSSLAVIAFSMEHSLSAALLALSFFFKEFHSDVSDEVTSQADQMVIQLLLLGRQYPNVVY